MLIPTSGHTDCFEMLEIRQVYAYTQVIYFHLWHHPSKTICLSKRAHRYTKIFFDRAPSQIVNAQETKLSTSSTMTLTCHTKEGCIGSKKGSTSEKHFTPSFKARFWYKFKLCRWAKSNLRLGSPMLASLISSPLKPSLMTLALVIVSQRSIKQNVSSVAPQSMATCRQNSRHASSFSLRSWGQVAKAAASWVAKESTLAIAERFKTGCVRGFTTWTVNKCNRSRDSDLGSI